MSAEVAEAAEVVGSAETTEPDDVNVGLIATIAIVGALLVVAIAAALTALVRSESNSYGFATGTYANLGTVKRLKAEQHAKLEQPMAWSDKAKQQVSLPIDRAKEIVVQEIQHDPFAATIAPAGAASAAPEAAPAASGAAPAGSAAAPGTAPPASSGSAAEKPDHGKHGAPAGGKLVDPQHGAPVTPAVAPAPKN
jgi:hypothetical protein